MSEGIPVTKIGKDIDEIVVRKCNIPVQNPFYAYAENVSVCMEVIIEQILNIADRPIDYVKETLSISSDVYSYIANCFESFENAKDSMEKTEALFDCLKSIWDRTDGLTTVMETFLAFDDKKSKLEFLSSLRQLDLISVFTYILFNGRINGEPVIDTSLLFDFNGDNEQNAIELLCNYLFDNYIQKKAQNYLESEFGIAAKKLSLFLRTMFTQLKIDVKHFKTVSKAKKIIDSTVCEMEKRRVEWNRYQKQYESEYSDLIRKKEQLINRKKEELFAQKNKEILRKYEKPYEKNVYLYDSETAAEKNQELESQQLEETYKLRETIDQMSEEEVMAEMPEEEQKEVQQINEKIVILEKDKESRGEAFQKANQEGESRIAEAQKEWREADAEQEKCTEENGWQYLKGQEEIRNSSKSEEMSTTAKGYQDTIGSVYSGAQNNGWGM